MAKFVDLAIPLWRTLIILTAVVVALCFIALSLVWPLDELKVSLLCATVVIADRLLGVGKWAWWNYLNPVAKD